MRPAAAWPETSREKCGPPASLSLLLPNIKLTSTPTQQHGRPSLRDRSHTAGDAAGRGTAAPSGPRRRGRSPTTRVEVKVRADVADGTEEEKKSAAEDDSWKKKRRARAPGCRVFGKVGLSRPLLVAVRYCNGGRCMWVRYKRQTHEEELGFNLITTITNGNVTF